MVAHQAHDLEEEVRFLLPRNPLAQLVEHTFDKRRDASSNLARINSLILWYSQVGKAMFFGDM